MVYVTEVWSTLQVSSVFAFQTMTNSSHSSHTFIRLQNAVTDINYFIRDTEECWGYVLPSILHFFPWHKKV